MKNRCFVHKECDGAKLCVSTGYCVPRHEKMGGFQFWPKVVFVGLAF